MWWLIALTPVIFLVVGLLYLAGFMFWHRRQTMADRFFSLPVQQRKQFEQGLKKHAMILVPFVKLLSAVYRLTRFPHFTYRGVTCPTSISSPATFAKSEAYAAGQNDIFIATQMKCGTTWMQQIVFEILYHGQGDLTDDGYRHMYALSPWLETSPNASVPIERAPYVSDYHKRIIKTHMPVQLTPYAVDAKYIYVTRNPVSCFASCKDFLAFLSGPFCPNEQNLSDWFCSDDMWWGAWPDHVEGWWNKSQQANNVFFITFEELKDDTRGVIARIAEFLEVYLTVEELEQVIERVSFAYMSENEAQFEMSAPNLFSVATDQFRFMQSGKKQRDQSVDEATKQRIMQFCSQRLQSGNFPFDLVYESGSTAVQGESDTKKVDEGKKTMSTAVE